MTVCHFFDFSEKMSKNYFFENFVIAKNVYWGPIKATPRFFSLRPLIMTKFLAKNRAQNRKKKSKKLKVFWPMSKKLKIFENKKNATG
jgi:hypothetical protein